MRGSSTVQAVSFDFGQTLAELDTDMLSARLAERGVAVAASTLDQHVSSAWGVYSRAIRAGAGGHPWKPLMRHLLASSGAPAARLDELVDWLWAEQPARNLWRRPIAGVVEIVRELHAARVPLAIVSNSEGRLAELAADLGWLDLFGLVADSGRLGIEKPDPRIFAWTAERIAVPPETIVHVGDAWAADVEGALAAGMWAVWFGPLAAEARELPPRVFACTDASSLRTVLTDLGLPIARG